MVTNASLVVQVKGCIIKIIPVNPKGNTSKLSNSDLQVPLNSALADALVSGVSVSIQVSFVVENRHVDEVYNILKTNFEKPFEPIDFCWRKQRIIALTRQNYSVEEIAAKLNVSVSAITQQRAGIYDMLEAEYKLPRTTRSINWYADIAGLGV